MTKTKLVTHRYFSYCQMVFAASKPFLLASVSHNEETWGAQEFGSGLPRSTTKLPHPNIMLSNKKGEEGSQGGLPLLAQEPLDISPRTDSSECLPLHPLFSFSLLPLPLIKPFLSQPTHFLALPVTHLGMWE